MRILFLLHSDIRQEQRVNKEIETLQQAGHEVVLVDFPSTQGAGTDVDCVCQRWPVRLWTRRLPRNLFFWPIKYVEAVVRFSSLGARARADVVHCVDRLTLVPGWIVARLGRVPFVYDTQEIWPEVKSALNYPRWLWLWIERHLSRRARFVMVTDQFRSKITSETLRLDPTKVFVLMSLPKVSKIGECTSGVRADSGFGDKRLVVYAGGLSIGRHLDDAILSLQNLPETCALTFIGFGSKEYKMRLFDLAAESGVSERFAILPPVNWSDIPAYIRSADCALALYEKCSINNLYCSPSKLFDAVIAGVPVVGTDNPLVVEVLEDLDAGEVIAEVTPAAIAGAISKVVARDDRAFHRSEIARRANAKYTWESQEQSLIDLYAGIAENRS